MRIGREALEEVLAEGRRLGFAACGAAPLVPSRMGRALAEWFERGCHAGMKFLPRTAPTRLDPRTKWNWARGALVAALSYAGGPPQVGTPGADPGGPGVVRYVSRYARGRDYHDVLKERLRAWGDRAEEIAGFPFRRLALCDTSAVLERELAVRAGLGWIGKNTCLVLEEGNSFVFLGVLLVEAELPVDSPPADLLDSSRCRDCRACLDACPTGALVEPFVLDARRCLSYLAIEHRGPIPAGFHGAIGTRLLGCDACQDACPWNRVAGMPGAPDPALAPLPALEELSLADVAALSEEGFRARFRGTAIARAKRAGLVRNALVVGANLADPGVASVAERLVDDPDEGVRAAARACLARLAGDDPRE